MTEQTNDVPNEILTETRAHARAARKAKAARRKSWPLAEIGLGAAIGSAAVAAAVLYARRRGERDD